MFKMNSLSLKKLSALLQQNNHQIYNLFIFKNNIYFMTILCEKYRNFFLLDLRTLPLLYSSEDNNFKVYHLHSYELNINYLKYIERIHDPNSFDDPDYKWCTRSLQKKRFEILCKNHAYINIGFFIDTLFIYSNYSFQIENQSISENFFIFIISINDYYIHQAILSQDIHKKYDALFEFILLNIKNQYHFISSIIKNTKKIDVIYKNIESENNNFQKRNHIISSIFEKIYHLSSKYPSFYHNCIDLMFLIFCAQSQFLLMNEDFFYNIHFHLSFSSKFIHDTIKID